MQDTQLLFSVPKLIHSNKYLLLNCSETSFMRISLEHGVSNVKAMGSVQE